MYHVSNETIFFPDDIVASFRLQKNVSEITGNMSKLILDIYAEVGVPNSIVCPHHIFYFTVLILSSTSVDRCLNAMFPLSWPRSSKEMTAMFSFGLVLLEIITGKRAVLSNEPDEDEETLVSWVSRFYPESYPLKSRTILCLYYFF